MSDRSRAQTVRDIMSSPPVTATPDESVADAASRMAEAKVGSVIVVEDGTCVGILTERDLIKLAAKGTPPGEARLAEWATKDPDTVPPDEDLSDAFRMMEDHGYRHLPVVENGSVAGIVSLRDLVRAARIQPVDRPAGEIPKGLEGIAVAETEIGDVRGREGFFHYRQFSAPELAERKSFEEVWHLLFEGHLPDDHRLRAFRDEVNPLRVVPDDVRDVLPSIAGVGELFVPLYALRAAYSTLALGLGFRPWLDVEPAELRSQALRTCAVFPTLIASMYRLNKGQDPVEPNPDLGHAANYLYMITGEVPSEDQARAVEQYLLLTIDHGFNASTFTARVITSTGADLGSAIIGAIGALSGPLHGGAPSRALDMLDDIGGPENAEEWLRDAVESGKRLMGFGHRVYRTDDPRSVMLRGVAEGLDGQRVEFAKQVEKRAVEVLQELKPGRELYPNVEFYAGIVLDMVGMPRELFTPTFAVSRVIGWCAHVMEQAADNRLIRPSARYVGPEPPQPVPD
ncbi:MAG: citrate synthase [Actinomycetota bacterium]